MARRSKAPGKPKKLEMILHHSDGTTEQGDSIMTEFPEGTYADITVQALTAAEKPTDLPPGTIPQWSNSNHLAGDLFVATDGMSGKLTYIDAGTGQITISAPNMQSAVLDYECLAGVPVILQATFGSVTPVV